MDKLAFDSSALLTWILQERGWQAVHRILQSGDFELVMPSPVLLECIYRAREQGNASSPDEIAETLEAQGFRVAAALRDDLVMAAEYHEVSSNYPYRDPATGKTHSLSLADCMVLAVCRRLECRVVTRDQYWSWLQREGHLDVEVVSF